MMYALGYACGYAYTWLDERRYRLAEWVEKKLS